MQTHIPSRMCLDCHQLTDIPVLTHAIERMSGPPWTAYACPDCAPRYLSTADAMSLLHEHAEQCSACTSTESCARGYTLALVVGRCLRRAQPTQPTP